MYVLVTSFDPPIAFVADEGLVRVCTEPYQSPAKGNMHVLLGHLTNYSINKLSKNYIHTEDMSQQEEVQGSKRTLQSLFKGF